MKFNKQKLTDIIACLETAELRRLITFLNSPYHVKTKDGELYLKLLKAISANNFRRDAIDDQEKLLFENLFPGKPFVPGKVEKKMAQFIGVLLDFLGLEEMKKNNALELETLKALRARRLVKLYEKELRKIKKNFNKNKNEQVDGYLAQFELHLEECRFLNRDPAKNDQASYDLTYNSLDNLYVNYFMYLGIVNLTYNDFIKPKEIRSRFEKLVYMMNKRSDISKSNIRIFEEKIFEILLNADLPDLLKIEELAKLLEVIKHELNEESYKNYRTLIRSFTISRYNFGDQSLRPILFKLYKTEVENKSIFFEKKIPSAAVNNIVILALRENDQRWLSDFLKMIEGRILEPNLSGFTLALNKGKLLFAQKKFEEVLDVLIFDVKNVYFKVYARILELMSYYELEIEQLHHKIDAYKIFIYRLPKSKMGKDFIVGHNNFIRILRSICHTSTIHDLSRIQRLKTKITETNILAEKEWLLDKVGELEKKNS